MPQLKIDLVVDDKGSLVLTGFGNKVDKVMWSSQGAVKRLGTELAVVGAGLAAFGGTVGLVGGSFIKVADEANRLQTSLDVITKGDGLEWFEKLNDWALKMPVNTNEAIRTFQLLRSMGLEPTIEDMTTLVDTSAAMGGEKGTLEGIARALGQIQTKGKVSAEELMQLAERGIPAYEILQEKLGLTGEQLANIGSQGIDANEAVQALLEGMSERFGGLSEKLNTMWSGQIETIRSYGKEFQRLVMDSGPMRELESGLDAVIAKLDQWKEDGTLKQWAEETGRYIVTLKGELTGLGADMVPYLRGIGEASLAIYNTAKAMESVGGPSVGEWGIIGYILLRGGGPAAQLATALLVINKQLENYNLNVGAVADSSRGFGEAFNNMVDVIQGQRDWNTGEWAEGTIGAMTDALEAGKGKVAAKFKEISTATGVSVVSMDELDKAVDDGLIHFDRMVGEWKAGAGEMAEAVGKSAEEQKQITSAKLEEMRADYQRYVDEVTRLQDLIAGRERSLAAELRAMARTGMDEMSAWRDRKAEADEYYQAAQRAASAGEFDDAVKYADEARQAYKELNKEVKAGDDILISGADALDAAMTGVKAAGELAIDVLGKQKQAAEDAARALDEEAGGQLSGQFDKAKDAVADLDQAIKDAGGDWGKVWGDMEQDAVRSIDAVDREIIKLVKDRYVNVTVRIKEVEQDSSGGLVGRYAGGGLAFPRLGSPYITSGGGMVDDVPALLKRNEFVMNPSATAYYGVDRMYAMNRRQVPRDAIATASTGGLAGDLGALVRRSNIQHFAEGGLAVPQAAASATGPALAIDLRISDGPAVRAWTDRQGYDSFLREAARRKRLASA